MDGRICAVSSAGSSGGHMNTRAVISVFGLRRNCAEQKSHSVWSRSLESTLSTTVPTPVSRPLSDPYRLHTQRIDLYLTEVYGNGPSYVARTVGSGHPCR